MPNSVAFPLAGLIVLALVIDALATGGAGAVFLGQRFLALIEWLAFWR